MVEADLRQHERTRVGSEALESAFPKTRDTTVCRRHFEPTSTRTKYPVGSIDLQLGYPDGRRSDRIRQRHVVNDSVFDSLWGGLCSMIVVTIQRATPCLCEYEYKPYPSYISSPKLSKHMAL
jgi:hypothetical protein